MLTGNVFFACLSFRRKVCKIPTDRPMDWFFNQHERLMKETSELYMVSLDDLKRYYIACHKRTLDKSFENYYEKFTHI
jgi:hypothetical protein